MTKSHFLWSSYRFIKFLTFLQDIKNEDQLILRSELILKVSQVQTFEKNQREINYFKLVECSLKIGMKNSLQKGTFLKIELQIQQKQIEAYQINIIKKVLPISQMCSTIKSTSISGEGSYYIKELSFEEIDAVSDKKSQDYVLKVKILQPQDENHQIIKSNRKIIKNHLRNSLMIPKQHSFLSCKNEKHTASSLRDLLENTDSSNWKNFSDKENSQSNTSSSRSLFCPTQHVISEVFDDKYVIQQKLGQGAHSTVYKCSSTIDNKLYALKKIQNVSFQNWNKLKNLYRMIKSINHKSIIGYHDYHFDQEKRTAYVVMEYCEFPDLRFQLSKHSINGKSFSAKQILNISKQIVDVLMYLHEEGICHRDLKPENILYCRKSGAIKIIDLDVCGVKKIKTQNFDMWTFTGTLFYRAPQSFEIGYSQKVDIWGLGIILYELVTGRVPFLTEYQKDFIHQIENTEINFSNLTKNSKLNALIRKCLQKDHHKRPSAKELFDFLGSKINDDEYATKPAKFQFERKRSSYTDNDTEIICLGNLLQLTFA